MQTTHRNTEAKSQIIKQALSLLIERGEVAELRVPGTSSGTCSGYFDDTQLLGDAAVELSGQGGGVYITINPVDRTLLARAQNRVRRYVKQGQCTADKDILRRSLFPIDFDAVRPAGISSTQEEHSAAILKATECRQWLVERGWPAPILADSGNGGHLLFRVDLPNDEASTRLLKDMLKVLGDEFDDEHVVVDPSTFNASRVWKLYGTLVCKGDPMPDRPHRVANIIEAPAVRLEVVPAELLAELAIALRPKSIEADGRKLASFGGGDYKSLDVVRWFQAKGRYGRDLGDGKHAVLCPWAEAHTDRRPAEDSDTVVWEAADGRWPVFHCSHAHCNDRGLEDVMDLWGDADSFCSGEFPPDKNGSQAAEHTGSNGHDRPTISVTDRHMRDITSDALLALEATDKNCPLLFSRGNSVVRIRAGDAGVSAEAMTNASLRGALDRVADFVSTHDKGDTPARPPPDVTADILSLPKLPFRRLRGFAQTPIFLPDGTLLRQSGYDSESGLYLHMADLVGICADVPIRQARELLMDELLGEFPFADDGSWAHVIAMLLQPFVRHMIDGPTPLFLIDAPARGTGKGLLADIASGVSLGRSAAVMALPKDDDELEKRVTAMMVEGHPMVLLDNVTALKSATLSAVLTTTLWRGRWLGKSQMVEAPNNATWVATGNNVALSDEMLRRTVHIRLDAGVERPEERAGFRHGDLMAWVRCNRAALLSACVSLAQAWIDAGMPSGSGTLGRYERWVEVMGGILELAGIRGFLTNRENLYGNADADTREWTSLCKAWWEQHATRPITAKDLFEIAKDNGLAMDLWAGRSVLSGQQRIGHALRARRDRVFGVHRIRNAGDDGQTKSLAYRLVIEG
jgi:hypothetical protein